MTVDAVVLIAFLVPLPLVASGLLLTKLITVVASRRVLPARRSAAWAQGAVLLACLAVLGYSAGVWSGHFFDLAAASELCPAGPLGDPALVDGLLPLSNSCNYADGSSTDLVPAFVNPFVLGCVAAAAGCVAGAVVTARGARLDAARKRGANR